MINEADSDEQTAEVKRIATLLDDSIALYWVPGNHDVAFDHNTPEQKYIDRYRDNFGPDYYAFTHKGIRSLSSTRPC